MATPGGREVTQGLRRLVRAKGLRISPTSIAIVTCISNLLTRAWKLRENVSANNAMHVAMEKPLTPRP